MATFYKMALRPNQSGYSVQHPNAIERMQMAGGASRYRQGKKNLPSLVTLQWTTSKNGYDYLVAFFKVWQNQYPAINPFLLDLIIDDSELMEYSCRFTGGLQLDQIAGHAYYISAEIEATAKKRNNDVDEIILLGVLDLLNPLEQLVNVDLPNALEVL